LWQRLQSQVAARERAGLFRAVRLLLDRLASRQPLALIFENGQWLDPASALLIEHIAASPQPSPILQIVARRSERHEPSAAENVHHVTLAHLSLDETAALVANLLGPAQASLVAGAVFEHSGGNPLFAEELVHWLRRREGPAALEDALRSSTTLQELVLSRVDALPVAAREAARGAALIGNEFTLDELGALLPHSAEATLLDNLNVLNSARLIFQSDGGEAPRFAFRQPLIREVLTDSQPFTRRREQHGKLAEYLAGRHATSLEQEAERLAHHYTLAEKWLPAARFELLSGHKARGQYAFDQAAQHYGKVLVALNRLPPTAQDGELAGLRLEAGEAWGDVLLLAESYSAAIAAYEQAWAALPEDAPSASLTRLLLKLALALPLAGRAEEGHDLAHEAWLLGDPPARLAAAAITTWHHWRRGEAAGEWSGAARELAALATGSAAAAIQAAIADWSGQWAAARQAYLSLDRPAGAALLLCREGEALLRSGERADALPLFREALALFEREGDRVGQAIAGLLLAQAAATTGRGGEAFLLRQDALARLGEDSGRGLDRLRRQHQDAFYVTLLFQP
jgi:hypothetical protein